LEASLYQTPMLIGYKGPWLIYLIYLLVRCIKRVSLPNIVLDKDVVAELVQGKFTVENICYETEKLLYDKEYREAHISSLGEVKAKLSDKYSAQEVAECIGSFL
jgi:lipid-A-disaccharide synthase